MFCSSPRLWGCGPCGFCAEKIKRDLRRSSKLVVLHLPSDFIDYCVGKDTEYKVNNHLISRFFALYERKLTWFLVWTYHMSMFGVWNILKISNCRLFIFYSSSVYLLFVFYLSSIRFYLSSIRFLFIFYFLCLLYNYIPWNALNEEMIGEKLHFFLWV